MCSCSSLNFSKRTILNCQAVHRYSLLYGALLGALLVFFGGVLFTWFFMTLESLPWYLYFLSNHFLLPDFKASLWQKEFFSSQVILGFWTCLLVSSLQVYLVIRVYFCMKPWPSSEVGWKRVAAGWEQLAWKRLLARFPPKWRWGMGSKFSWLLCPYLLDSWGWILYPIVYSPIN